MLVPASAISYAFFTTSSTSTLPSPRPTLDPYNHPPLPRSVRHAQSAIFDSAIQQSTSMFSSLSDPQYSRLDLIMGVLLAFSTMMVFLSYQILIKRKDIHTVIQRMDAIPEYIKNYFDYAAWQMNYIGLIIAQCIWLCGYCTPQMVLTFLITYILIAIVCFMWLSLKLRAAQGARLLAQWAVAAGPLAIQCVRALRKWTARRSIQWYNDGTIKKHIKNTGERWLTRNSTSEFLFPRTYSILPNRPTQSQMFKAIATDLSFLAWNSFILLFKLRLQSCTHIRRHAKDVYWVTLQIIFGLDGDDLSWPVWMACFKCILRNVRMVIDKLYTLVTAFCGSIQSFVQLLQAWYRRAIVFFAFETFGIDGKKVENPNSYAHETFNAFMETSSYNWCKTALLYLRLKATEEDLAEARREPKSITQQGKPDYVHELANKCVGYRRTLLEVVSDNNYLRLLACSMLNAHHNIINGRRPNDLYAEHPYQPSLIKFTPVPDQQTGLYLGYNEHTRRKDHDLGHEYRRNVENFAMDIAREPHRMSAILKRHPLLRGHVPDHFDPFLKDHWVFSGVIPGMNIPSYTTTNNPFDITAKRARPITNPAQQFGPQIEDFAADGRLDQWTEFAAPKQKSTPFSSEGLRGFTKGMRFGATPLRKHAVLISSAVPLRAYAADPCPRGEPRRGDLPVYRKNFA